MICYLPDARLLRPSGRNPLHYASFFTFVVVIIALYKCSGLHCLLPSPPRITRMAFCFDHNDGGREELSEDVLTLVRCR